MSEKVYKKIRLVGCSTKSFEKAAAAAVGKASETLHGLSWFEVVELRGAVKDGKIEEYQATLDVSFKLE